MKFIPWSIIASFIVGLMVGAAGLNLISGTHLENAQLEIERLNAQLIEKSEQISALEETIAQHEKWAVTEIEVHVSFKSPKHNDELNTLEIEKTVKELLKNIRGREVCTLDPTLVFNIVNGRSIEVSGVEFIVSVESILVAEKLEMYVEAAEKQKPVTTQRQLNKKEDGPLGYKKPSPASSPVILL